MYSMAGGHSKNIGGAGGEESKKVIIFMGIFKSDNAKSRVSCSIFFSFSYLQGDPFQLCLLTV